MPSRRRCSSACLGGVSKDISLPEHADADRAGSASHRGRPTETVRRDGAGRVVADRGAGAQGHDVTLFASGDFEHHRQARAGSPQACGSPAFMITRRVRCDARGGAAPGTRVRRHPLPYRSASVSVLQGSGPKCRDDDARSAGPAVTVYPSIGLFSTCRWSRSRTISVGPCRRTRTGCRPSITVFRRISRVQSGSGKYLAFLGRISPEKRPTVPSRSIAKASSAPRLKSPQKLIRPTTTISRDVEPLFDIHQSNSSVRSARKEA